MSYFDEFNPFVDTPPVWPFRRLNQIALRASSLVRHLSMDELVECAIFVEKTIAEERETTIAQQNALISELNAKLQGMETVVATPKVVGERRLIGVDWSDRTSAEAKEAGVTHTVLCKDGYYVP